jgi:hypothetical protein
MNDVHMLASAARRVRKTARKVWLLEKLGKGRDDL